jgi:hypothetical protein
MFEAIFEIELTKYITIMLSAPINNGQMIDPKFHFSPNSHKVGHIGPTFFDGKLLRKT